ncbi:MAG: NAD(P)H-quinone oxidoreductase [Candidatus Obscuribacterales bacterium]|nr:NAD(P)H-quinone oxidoreductase [Candidatus Obscuribacterales bacterium]
MRAVVIDRPGGPEVLQVKERPAPEPGPGEVKVRVHAAGINRADVLQRKGFYPAPPDAPADIPGLEFAGEIVEVGPSVFGWNKGDRVFGLAGGGTYAEYVVVHNRALARIPSQFNYIEAAAIPEVFITAYDAIVVQCGLMSGETVLIHAVGSGVGLAAVQIVKALSAVSIGTARSQDKLDRAKALGVDHCILARDAVFAEEVLSRTAGKGVDVVLELVGGSYVPEDLKCLAQKGRAVIVGLVNGARCDFDLALVLRKRIMIKGTTLRARPLEEKIEAIQLLSRNIVPLLEKGLLTATIDKVLPMTEAGEAHKYMEENLNFGKIILRM